MPFDILPAVGINEQMKPNMTDGLFIPSCCRCVDTISCISHRRQGVNFRAAVKWGPSLQPQSVYQEVWHKDDIFTPTYLSVD